jgi:homocitrate synthase NifV
MDKCINLIDHTINSILTERQDAFLDYKLFDILKKYGVSTVDLSVNSVKSILRPVKSLTIRMEIDACRIPVRDLEQYYTPSINAVILRWRNGDELSALKECLEFARYKMKQVYLKIINTSTLTHGDFEEYGILVKEYGVSGFILCDIESRLDPYTVIDYVNFAKDIISCKIEFCAGNGCGLATANSLAAIRCGIVDIHTVVGGANLTEGAAMEEIILTCKYFQMAEVCERTPDLAKDSRRILQSMQLKVPVDKAIIGNGIFSHESGIHVDGIMKNPKLYEVISPEDVGVKRKIVIGKHSGKASIRMRYQQMGLKLTEEEVAALTDRIKQLALSQNASLSYKQLIALYTLNVNINRNKEVDTDENITTI